MNKHDIYEKSAAGVDEVRLRTRGLHPRLRTMLIMVDGTRTLEQLETAAATLGAPSDFLGQLLSQDLVVLRIAAPRAAAAAKAAPSSVPAPAPAAERPAVPSAPASPVLPATDAERFRATQKFMNDCAVDAMGIRAFFWTLKLEKASTCDDLRQLLPEFRKAMAKARNEAAAALLETRARSMLG
jgi:hypothetical protein